MRTHGTVDVLRILCVTVLLASSATGAQAQNPAPGAPVTAADVNALRAQAEAQNPNGCSSVFRWTDDPIVPGQTPVKAHHLIELRRAINEMVRGVCPTLHEQVTVAGVSLLNGTSGYRYVQGAVLNAGTTPVTGRLGVRVRLFTGGQPIAEAVSLLVRDNRYTNSLDVQEQHLFSVRFADSAVRGWEYFQVVAFEADGRSVLCSGCAQRHARKQEEVRIEGVHFLDATSGYRYVAGSVVNAGLTRITGSLGVRVRFFDSGNQPIAEAVGRLVRDNSYTNSLDVQEQHLFSVRFADSAIQGWDHFQVVAFEDDRRSVSCSGCDQRHARPSEQVTFENVGFLDASDRYSYVSGSILNSGSTRLVGTLAVRVRYFRSGVLFTEARGLLIKDNSYTNSLAIQDRHLFSVRIEDSQLQGGWDHFQVTFENDGVTMDCTNCDRQYRP